MNWFVCTTRILAESYTPFSCHSYIRPLSPYRFFPTRTLFSHSYWPTPTGSSSTILVYTRRSDTSHVSKIFFAHYTARTAASSSLSPRTRTTYCLDVIKVSPGLWSWHVSVTIQCIQWGISETAGASDAPALDGVYSKNRLATQRLVCLTRTRQPIYLFLCASIRNRTETKQKPELNLIS